MTEIEFYKTTPRTFQNILQGHFSEYKLKMELHREIVLSLLLPNMKEADRKKPASHIYPLPWDKKAKKAPVKDPLDFWADIDKRTKKE
jgi:hypothetical protein